jgi:membrane fusion protein (multidrug efflux system)
MSDHQLENEYGVAPARRRSWLLWVGGAAAVLVVGGVVWSQAANGAATTAGSAAGGSTASQPAAAEAKAGEKKEEPAVPVSVVAAETGTIAAYLEASANLVAEQEVQVLAEAEGRVAQLAVDEGVAVRKGQMLAQLVRDDAQIAVQKAELRAESAQAAYARGQNSMQSELLSREAFDKLATEHQIAQQELAEARLRLEKTTIRAPFDGVVASRSVTLGQHVRPGDALFVVTDRDPLVARIFVPEKDLAELAEGKDVRLALESRPELALVGKIRQISPVVDVATGTVKVTVEAVAPPREVRPGSFVSVSIVREERPNAVLVPKQAVLRELQAAHVFVEKDGKASRREVKLGLEEGDKIEIADGLEGGERIITAGQGSLKDGAAVKVIGEAPTATAASPNAPSTVAAG